MTVYEGDLIRVTCRFKSTQSGDIVNVYHFWVSAGASASDSEMIADLTAYIDSLYSPLAGQLSNVSDPYDIRFDQVQLVGGVEVVIRNIATQSWTLTSPPAASGETIPAQNAAIVNLRTRFPRVFGRKYLGPFGEGNTGNGTFNASALTAFAAFGADLIGTIAGTTLTYVAGVLSAKAGAGNNFFAEFVGAVINAISGTQRRRRINRGS